MFKASVIITSATIMLGIIASAEAEEASVNYRVCFLLFHASEARTCEST